MNTPVAQAAAAGKLAENSLAGIAIAARSRKPQGTGTGTGQFAQDA